LYKRIILDKEWGPVCLPVGLARGSFSKNYQGSLTFREPNQRGLPFTNYPFPGPGSGEFQVAPLILGITTGLFLGEGISFPLGAFPGGNSLGISF